MSRLIPHDHNEPSQNLQSQRSNALLHRRQTLQLFSAASIGATFAAPSVASNTNKDLLPVAAVVTVYRKNSHADVLVGKILDKWRQGGGPESRLNLVSVYTDQVPENDLSRSLAKKHGFRIASTIDDALTLGTDELKVAGVLSIGEHGTYPSTPAGQKMYPRRRFFDEIAGSMQRCRNSVPVFNDKHLSWNLPDALHIYNRAQEQNIPIMAGSSLPVAWRYPAELLPLGSDLTEAIVVGYGRLESYGFHALEALQCVVERRRGAESGIASVQALGGDQIWQAEQQGQWNRQLLNAALATFGKSADDLERQLKLRNSALFLINYKDGFKAACAMFNGVASEVAVACNIRNKAVPFANWFRLQEERPYGHFGYLLQAIEPMIATGKPSTPVERTLLTTGILANAMQSLHDGGTIRQTPELAISYAPSDWPFANQFTENFPAP